MVSEAIPAPQRSLRRRLVTSLPPEMESQAARRLGNLGLGFGVMFTSVFIVRWLAISSGLIDRSLIDVDLDHLRNLPLANGLTVGFAILNFTLYALSRSRLPAWKVLKLGLFFEFLLCCGLAFEEQLFLPLNANGPPRLSFCVIIILSFPMLIPTPFPRRALATALCALCPALISPLATSVAGNPTPPLPALISHVIPLVISGGFALYAGRLAHQLRRQVSEARQVGSYRLIEKLGSGAMGEVWRARHRLLARDAAVKLIRPEMLGDSNDVVQARFEREAQATARLESPHTVALYDYGQSEDGVYFYAMALLRGMTLDDLVKQHGPVSSARALFLLRQIALSLAEAHDNGLIHRDVKPANIFLTRAGRECDFVKVLDFGLVKSVGFKQDIKLTQDHVTTGTPAFMAPEVALEEDIDARADVYGFGCVAYWLLTGRLVFEADTPLKAMMAHVHEAPPPPSTSTELAISPELDAFVLRCLEKSPEQRPQDAGALVTELDAVIAAETKPWKDEQAHQWWSLHHH
ncbi:MAG: serine/threonine-protein kinase [Myxococcota bacterium]